MDFGSCHPWNIAITSHLNGLFFKMCHYIWSKAAFKLISTHWIICRDYFYQWKIITQTRSFFPSYCKVLRVWLLEVKRLTNCATMLFYSQCVSKYFLNTARSLQKRFCHKDAYQSCETTILPDWRYGRTTRCEMSKQAYGLLRVIAVSFLFALNTE